MEIDGGVEYHEVIDLRVRSKHRHPAFFIEVDAEPRDVPVVLRPVKTNIVSGGLISMGDMRRSRFDIHLGDTLGDTGKIFKPHNPVESPGVSLEAIENHQLGFEHMEFIKVLSDLIRLYKAENSRVERIPIKSALVEVLTRGMDFTPA